MHNQTCYDPIVLLAHARALLTSSPEGRTAYVDASLQPGQERSPPSDSASRSFCGMTV